MHRSCHARRRRTRHRADESANRIYRSDDCKNKRRQNRRSVERVRLYENVFAGRRSDAQIAVMFSHSFTVDADDIDEQGHVNNVSYLRWVQNIAVAHWRHAAREELQEKFTWFVTRHEIDYKKPAFAGEEITAKTWVGEMKIATCERFTEIRRGEVLL